MPNVIPFVTIVTQIACMDSIDQDQIDRIWVTIREKSGGLIYRLVHYTKQFGKKKRSFSCRELPILLINQSVESIGVTFVKRAILKKLIII